MKSWRLGIISLLILALPVASIATTSNIHCINHIDSAPTQAELSSSDHCSSEDSFKTATDSSQPAECPCDCNSTLGCLSSGVNSFALSTLTKATIAAYGSQLSIDQIDQFTSFHSPPLIRPPITIS